MSRANNRRAPNWTLDEFKIAQDMAKARATHREIAAALGRTELAVKVKASRMAKQGKPICDRRKFKLVEVQSMAVPKVLKRVLKRAVDEGFTIKEIARRSGMSREAVRSMARYGNPRIGCFLAVAQVVGFDVSLRLRDDEREAFRAEDVAA